MTDYDTLIKQLKAQEQAKAQPPAWPTNLPPPDPAKLKKKPPAAWPTPIDKPKKPPRPASHSFVSPELPTRPFQQGGYTLAEIIRVAVFVAALLALILYFD